LKTVARQLVKDNLDLVKHGGMGGTAAALNQQKILYVSVEMAMTISLGTSFYCTSQNQINS
jgi:hypothetical protein